MKKLILLFSIIAGPAALAYIPPYWMILSRTADNHGRGTYVVEQDIVYKSETDNQIVHEVWTVSDENHMRLNFQGLGPLKDVVKGTVVYENHSRVVNENGANKTQKLGDDWVEPYFYFRSSKNMRNKLVQLKMAPPDSLRDEGPMKADGDPNYTPPSFVRLARLNGLVAWAIEKQVGSPDQPAIWIEQDQFVVSKVRTATKNSVEANDYGKYENGFYVPRARTYRWGERSVVAQLKNVKSLGSSAKGVTTTTGLTPFQFSGSDAIREFYLRFR
jgi:hypothetical protein